MPKISDHHQQYQVRCDMNEPIQLLIDKLSSKSPQLYIFWQNYDQMYRSYNEKVIENTRLRQQIQHIKRSMQQRPPEVKVQEDPYLKDRLKVSENTCEQLRSQMQKIKNINRDMKMQQNRLIEQINQMQILISQLRQQNSQQRISIANILQKLKSAQNEINGYEKVYEQMQEKQLIVNKLIQREKQMQGLLQDKEDQIQRLAKDFKDTKNKYQRIIKESMQNAKESVMNSLPHSYKMGQKNRMAEF